MSAKKVYLHNLGCKVNSYEAAAAAELLEKAGYEMTLLSECADVIIINTCTVTAVADKKSRQMLHRAKTSNPDAVVIAMGCYVEKDREELLKDRSVDLIIGNNRKKDIVSILEKFLRDREQNSWFADLGKGAEYESLSADRPLEHTRAFVKIQDGCDSFCSYCIIPYVRGRIRSRDEKEVCAEVQKLADSGIREIVLTGIHLSSYGKDKGREALLPLIEELAAVEGIDRIRLGSLEAGIITGEFAKGLSSFEKVCPHFHLSLQSGCSATLKRMNRHYTAEEFYEKCALIRECFVRPALTTDVIAGFPGETEEEFEESYRFVEKVGFFETHVFPFSGRKGTKAYDMPGQLTEAVKKERVRRLLELNACKRAEYLESGKGTPLEILFEEQDRVNGKLCWVGHTKRYEKAAYESPKDLKNRIFTIPYEDAVML
ncbi:MAG: tRNA (N(6)-L-threonylcarbamoyladenosine(37)-C(2))-methylthiotransferase MtaB [Lachnospiraceae bacterium]|nr:tRNA (N(6)-L-threonylcarbamoyladenosine(37)-C(2))-methylthiotransferase MtaB [Lachnospiraceae bacterium]